MELEQYYKTLNIPVSSSQEEIRQAYNKLSVQYHPHYNKNNEEKFKEITDAYEMLYKDDIIYYDEITGEKYVLTNDELFGRDIKKNTKEAVDKALKENECKIQ